MPSATFWIPDCVEFVNEMAQRFWAQLTERGGLAAAFVFFFTT